MSKNYLKGIIGNRRPNISAVESAGIDSHLLRFCGMPSVKEHRLITFHCILSELVHYLERGGKDGFPLDSFTPTVMKFFPPINTFIEFVGFPTSCWSALQVAIEDRDTEALARACRKAIEAFDSM